MLDDLLELVGQDKQDAVDACIEMLEDLHLYGNRSRFVQNMQGVPLLELKTRSRGAKRVGRGFTFTGTVLVNPSSWGQKPRRAISPSWIDCSRAWGGAGR